MRFYFYLVVMLLSFHLDIYPAKLSVPIIFQDNMILQRDRKVPIFGGGENQSTVTVRFHDKTYTTQVTNGRWKIYLDPAPAGGPHQIAIESLGETLVIKNILFGDVWLAGGQSNMEFNLPGALGGKEAAAKNIVPFIRLFHVPAKAHPDFKPWRDYSPFSWWPLDPTSASRFSAIAYFFALELYEQYKVPIGIINCNLGATPIQAWMSKDIIQNREEYQIIWQSYLSDFRKFSPEEHHARMKDYFVLRAQYEREAAIFRTNSAYPRPIFPEKPKGPYDQTRPGIWHENMVRAISPYALKGIIFYQGENNVNQSHIYRDLMDDLITQWRSDFENPRMPFLFTQLAAFGSLGGPQDVYAKLRDAQTRAAQTIPYTGMALALDLGEEKDIHPRNKAPVAHRLFLLAQELAYGETIASRSPLLTNTFIGESNITLAFQYAYDGLFLTNNGQGFEISFDDSKYIPCRASANGSSIIITPPDGSTRSPHRIRSVRYAWANFPQYSVYNSALLPAIPFSITVSNNKMEP